MFLNNRDRLLLSIFIYLIYNIVGSCRQTIIHKMGVFIESSSLLCYQCA